MLIPCATFGPVIFGEGSVEIIPLKGKWLAGLSVLLGIWFVLVANYLRLKEKKNADAFMSDMEAGAIGLIYILFTGTKNMIKDMLR